MHNGMEHIKLVIKLTWFVLITTKVMNILLYFIHTYMNFMLQLWLPFDHRFVMDTDYLLLSFLLRILRFSPVSTILTLLSVLISILILLLSEGQVNNDWGTSNKVMPFDRRRDLDSNIVFIYHALRVSIVMICCAPELQEA
jgi:hypothetical protein